MTYLNVWKAWQESGRDRKWAARHCLHHRALLRAADIRSQLCHHLRHAMEAFVWCLPQAAKLLKSDDCYDGRPKEAEINMCRPYI